MVQATDGFLHLTGRSKDTVALVFSALQIRREPSFDFWQTFDDNKHIPADVIFIRDTENMWYQTGTGSAYGNFMEIVYYLRKHIQPYKRVVAIGSSMGGYAAMAALTCMPKINTCLAIAPQTFIDAGNREKYGDHRWEEPEFRRRMIVLNQMLKRTEFYDLKPLYARKDHLARPVHIVYGDDDRIDKAHAKHMKGAAGVILHPIKDSDHFVGQTLKERNLLVNLVEQIVASDSIKLHISKAPIIT